ncbi:transposase [Anaerostipes sp. MSJ-23]|uniref:transposase n=1 Tax=Anaerostipes sp. MSJ-23 TaxID=2841520 RepID=UPI001C10FED7|nr:transposase [Anaerostipes sp. MSJ-23]
MKDTNCQKSQKTIRSDILKKYYWKLYFWSDKYFISSVNKNRKVIKQFIRNQEKNRSCFRQDAFIHVHKSRRRSYSNIWY